MILGIYNLNIVRASMGPTYWSPDKSFVLHPFGTYGNPQTPKLAYYVANFRLCLYDPWRHMQGSHYQGKTWKLVKAFSRPGKIRWRLRCGYKGWYGGHI